MTTKRDFPLYGLLVFTVILIGVGLVWYSTEQLGSGLISDSYQYVSAARSLVSGKGFKIPYGDNELLPMTKYPPMLSIVLALFEIVKINSFHAATYLNMFLFGLSIYLVALITKKLTASKFYSIVTSLLVAVSPVMVEVHTWVLSEPLYICLSLLVFLMFGIYFERQSRPFFFLAAFFSSLLFLTRYIGISLILAVVLFILFVERTTWKRKIVDALIFGSVSTLPTVLWTLRGIVFTGTFNDRSIQFHPLSNKNYLTAIHNVLAWFFPQQIISGREKFILFVGGIVGLVLLIYFIFYFKKKNVQNAIDMQEEWKSILLHCIYIFSYGIMLIASKTWVDDQIGMTDRILSPLYASFVILLMVLFANLSKYSGKIVFYTCILYSIFLVGYNVSEVVPVVRDLNQKGAGVFHSGWHYSEAVSDLRTYSSYSIFTNSNSTLYIWSDRSGYSLGDFRNEQETDREALLVIFKHVPPKGDKLEKLVSGLKLLEEDKYVAVYLIEPTQ